MCFRAIGKPAEVTKFNWKLRKSVEESAVLAQMLYDALSDFENKFINKDEKKAAEFWLTHKTKNFVDVCTYAGFDADYVIGKSKKLINLKNLKRLGIVWNHERKTKYEGDMSRVQG